MKIDIFKNFKDEIDELVKYGDKLCKLASGSPDCLEHDYITETSVWVTRIGQIIKNISSEDSQYYQNYEDILKTSGFYLMHSTHFEHICVLNGIIKAIQNDYDKGLLLNFKKLLEAEIFADFLEMSEYLLKQKYKDAAAVIIGSVLEDALRKLAISNGIEILKNNGSYFTMEPLNMELTKADVYDKLIQKQITSWGELRNKAAHGHYDEYDEKQVEMMLLFVQKFVSDHLK